jgi:hypothetical protein
VDGNAARWNAAPHPDGGTGPSCTSRLKDNACGTPGERAIVDANTDLLAALPTASHAGFVELLSRALQATVSAPKNRRGTVS